ncbi:hypothetical protein DEU56DRAFT_921244 [Suillus clintonianus]|uniref:uncharacterized protein n=1 Tax=Suillus clintonianus TaxID=1904413 RepID=UPI001B85ECDB|nr:uncharacterized protein DEU56DRAFT_921244 [Suillus clintonianus]KAG2157220.1 hypothetical protein DEU56DRAFT_921244 [Suillus clintonianus]
MLPLTKAWSLIVVLAAAAVVPRGAFAQTSNVTCVAGFDWMNNSISQNPCTVASYLESVCWGGDFTISPLPVDTHYAAPTTAEANSCECSSVTYSLISACGDCQNRTYLTWASWSYNCSVIYPQVYPMNIPSGTLVPQWAYLNVTNGFDPVAAQSVGDLPESTATKVQSTGTVTYSTSVSASATGISAAAGSSTTTSSPTASKSSNVGAIAGGVVGGIVGAAAIIGFATWLFVKRRRSSTAPSAAFSDIGGGPGYTHSVYSANPSPFPMQPQMTQQQRLYDPSDPTTFPGSPPSPTLQTTGSSNIYHNPSIPSAFSQQPRPGQYSGTPEI